MYTEESNFRYQSPYPIPVMECLYYRNVNKYPKQYNVYVIIVLNNIKLRLPS